MKIDYQIKEIDKLIIAVSEINEKYLTKDEFKHLNESIKSLIRLKICLEKRLKLKSSLLK